MSFKKMNSLWRSFGLPIMLLKLYSLMILMLDLIVLFFRIYIEILFAIYRTFYPVPLKSLHQEVAMVVGASRGIGKELTVHLCKLGANVACVDNNSCSDTINDTAGLLGVAKSYDCDITNEKEVSKTVQDICTTFGNITMIFHCCGVPSPRSVLENIPNERRIMEVTVLSHFWLLNEVLPQMKRIDHGHIVLLSSMAGLSVTATEGSRVPTSTAQFAIQGLAESLRTELKNANHNITVTLIHVYPFIIGAEAASDIRFRIPSFFGTMPAVLAAQKILDGVRRNYAEFSIPVYLLYLGHIFRILPKKASYMLRELLDTGIDFV